MVIEVGEVGGVGGVEVEKEGRIGKGVVEVFKLNYKKWGKSFVGIFNI